MNDNDSSALIEQSIELAEKIQNVSISKVNKVDKRYQDLMLSFVDNPYEKIIFTQIIDQGLRCRNDYKAVLKIKELFRNGIPQFIKGTDRILTYFFNVFGKFFAWLAIPLIVDKFRTETKSIILAGEKRALTSHLRKRRKEGVKININHLGEVVLGKTEAENRLNEYIRELENPEVFYISVKITSIASQLQPLAFDHNKSLLKERLITLFSVAKKCNKHVNIDMEEYRHVDLTVDAFKESLETEDLLEYTASLALQAYIPDSHAIQDDLLEWVKSRVAVGGAPIKIRLVKGANLEMESFDSELHSWSNPIYTSKLEVDASFKIMLEKALLPENAPLIHIGVASHNLFDLCYAYVLAEKNDVGEHVTFEMLEGMADPVRKSFNDVFKAKKSSIDLLLYAPIVTKEYFINAMAYLVRRMDENTYEENFMRHSFGLTVGSEDWDYLKKQFADSFALKTSISKNAFRCQNRLDETSSSQGAYETKEFKNEPDTDWSRKENREWVDQIISKWNFNSNREPIIIPKVINGEEIYKGAHLQESIDKSQFKNNIVVSKFLLCNEEEIELAVKVAQEDPDGWRNYSIEERHKVLSVVAEELRKSRGDLIGAMSANTGKVFAESDVEISEAIDFAEFYPHSIRFLEDLHSISYRGKGVGLVIPPWNFPCAIPAGGVITALAAGNTVLLKPSSDAVLVAWIFCQCFWNAGISKKTLQFVPCSGSTVGAHLAAHPGIDFIIFTGGTDTALNIIEKKPDVTIAAETGGKNATIVTVMADYDQAINNIIHSAFSNCGQKCSATSLLILEKEVYDDKQFKKQLVDAVESYSTGSSWELQNRMGPLIHPPQGDLKKTIHSLEEGESWLVPPRNVDGNPYLWRPCVKWNVQPGSFCHQTEFFGPVLSVMKADSLLHAIEITNSTGYGLTSGLESLDEKEQSQWVENIRAGNLYINRVTTGAIVLRQPFGGMGKSAYGAGVKAGGPNYVLQFMDYEENGPPTKGEFYMMHPLMSIIQPWIENITLGMGMGLLGELSNEVMKSLEAIYSYVYNYETFFYSPVDYFKLRGQDNIFRYIPLGTVVVRVADGDSLFSILGRVAASLVAGNETILSLPETYGGPEHDFIFDPENHLFFDETAIIKQRDEQLVELMPKIAMIRYGSSEAVPMNIYKEAAKTGFYIARTPVLMEGRLELLHYLQEQSISHNYHRYGNLGVRGLED